MGVQQLVRPAVSPWLSAERLFQDRLPWEPSHHRQDGGRPDAERRSAERLWRPSQAGARLGLRQLPEPPERRARLDGVRWARQEPLVLEASALLEHQEQPVLARPDEAPPERERRPPMALADAVPQESKERGDGPPPQAGEAESPARCSTSAQAEAAARKAVESVPLPSSPPLGPLLHEAG